MAEPSNGIATAAAVRPRYWQEQISGELARAVHAFLTDPNAMTEEQVIAMRAYVIQWIECPVWDANPHLNDAGRAWLHSLRWSAKGISSMRMLSRWLLEAAEFGCDPL